MTPKLWYAGGICAKGCRAGSGRCTRTCIPTQAEALAHCASRPEASQPHDLREPLSGLSITHPPTQSIWSRNLHLCCWCNTFGSWVAQVNFVTLKGCSPALSTANWGNTLGPHRWPNVCAAVKGDPGLRDRNHEARRFRAL